LLFEHCMERFDRKDLALMAVVARRISLRRNAYVFEGKFDHPNGLYLEAVASLDEFRRCNLKETLPAPQDIEDQGATLSLWLPPPEGVIKVNWDASLNVSKGWTGLGIIARDNLGFCLGARSVTKQV
jgi:hypothetical protein